MAVWEVLYTDQFGSWFEKLRVSKGGAIRILFAFDLQRQAVLLLGGDKAGQWESWYSEAIPMADGLFDEYLRETGQA